MGVRKFRVRVAPLAFPLFPLLPCTVCVLLVFSRLLKPLTPFAMVTRPRRSSPDASRRIDRVASTRARSAVLSLSLPLPDCPAPSLPPLVKSTFSRQVYAHTNSSVPSSSLVSFLAPVRPLPCPLARPLLEALAFLSVT